jgi:hypothetical protein
MKTSLAALLLASSALAAGLPPAVTLVSAACGSDDIHFDVKPAGRPAPQLEPGKALVFVVEDYETPKNELGRVTVRVGVDGAWIGADRGSSWLSFAASPGEHHLCVDWQSPHAAAGGPKVSLNRLDAEAGQTYYFRARMTEHSLSLWTLDLDRVNSDEGQRLVGSFPLSDYRQKK